MAAFAPTLQSDSQPLVTASLRSDPDLKWYAVRVRSNFEQSAALVLREKGYDEFLPLYKVKRRWADRISEAEKALFPGYLFCRFDARERQIPILTTPGVMSILGVGKMPHPVSDEEIASIQAVIRSGLPAQPCPSVAVGSTVVIEKGPLAGVQGIAVRVDKKYRLVLSVPLLQRSVIVEIEREWARQVGQNIGGVDDVPRRELSAMTLV